MLLSFLHQQLKFLIVKACYNLYHGPADKREDNQGYHIDKKLAGVNRPDIAGINFLSYRTDKCRKGFLRKRRTIYVFRNKAVRIFIQLIQYKTGQPGVFGQQAQVAINNQINFIIHG